MKAIARAPVPLAQAFELDLKSSICRGLVSYIACLPSHGMVPREFHPHGRGRPFTRAGTTATELRGRNSTATGRGGHSAYPMATVSTGATDAWTLNYGSNSIIDAARPISLVTLTYCNAVSINRKRAVRFYSGTTTGVYFEHGNDIETPLFAGVRLTDTVVANVKTPAPSAGTDIIIGYDYIPSSSTQTLYADGALTTPTGTSAGTGANISAVTDICLGNNIIDFPFKGGIGVVGLWNRQLSADEHAALAANPYLPLRRSRPRLTLVPASGGSTAVPVFRHHYVQQGIG